jgi:hypothetical protein
MDPYTVTAIKKKKTEKTKEKFFEGVLQNSSNVPSTVQMTRLKDKCLVSISCL